ncbi:MAG: hypothetical protein V3W51_06270 [Candidatus Brocadiales bacterium]
MRDLAIKVKAYAGYKAEERPLAFTLEGKEYRIEEVLDTSVEERAGRRLTSFCVRTDAEGGVFKIYCCGEEGNWYLER